MEGSASNMQLLSQMITGCWVSQAIYVAAELGIADLLADGPRTAEELAEHTNANSGALYRVLRALASVGIFAEDVDQRFTLTPLAEGLRSDGFSSQRSLAIMMGAELYRSWGNLLPAVRTGERAFDKTFGMPFFQYMTEHPERHRAYDAAMTGAHGAETEPMLDAYDFSAFRTVIDVGGGNGLVLAALLNRHPAAQGVLFDLPDVVEGARPIISDLGLIDRCQVVGGDFFSSVPAGGDAYLMRHVIHDWDDEQAVSILGNCRDAMNGDGRILVVESVIPPASEPSFGKWLDLMMLVVGGRERTEAEYRRLFSEAGLTLSRVVPTAHEVSVIEGLRAA